MADPIMKSGDVPKEMYTSQFFSDIAPGSLRSATVVLGLLFDLYRPASVLDVGCGQGSWLAAAEDLGATKLHGYDGPWVNPETLLRPSIKFRAVNLEGNFGETDKFDLCISVEVAEHLARSSAKTFVKSLCATSDLIVFSAAIPMQGGVNHLNEQPQSFWASLFESEGYVHYDLFRPKVWNDPRVESWYRQNVLLYVKRDHPLSEKLSVNSLMPGPLDVIHPEIYQGNLENYKKPTDEPTLRFCFQCLLRWLQRQWKKVSH